MGTVPLPKLNGLALSTDMKTLWVFEGLDVYNATYFIYHKDEDMFPRDLNAASALLAISKATDGDYEKGRIRALTGMEAIGYLFTRMALDESPEE